MSKSIITVFMLLSSLAYSQIVSESFKLRFPCEITDFNVSAKDVETPLPGEWQTLEIHLKGRFCTGVHELKFDLFRKHGSNEFIAYVFGNSGETATLTDFEARLKTSWLKKGVKYQVKTLLGNNVFDLTQIESINFNP